MEDPEAKRASFPGHAYYYYDPLYGYVPYPPYYPPYWYTSNPHNQGFDHSLPRKGDSNGTNNASKGCSGNDKSVKTDDLKK